jgi:hypothetical protein
MTDDPLDLHVLWHCPVLSSTEYASLTRDHDGYRLHGVALLSREGVPSRIDYEAVTDHQWSRSAAHATVTTPTQVLRIELRSTTGGAWELDGVEAPQLRGCTDLDLGWTPSTNTIPIRRLGLQVGESAAITAAWVRFPELDVLSSEQHYTRLGDDRWRYRSGAFDAELVIDPASGLVLAYGDDLWRAAAITRG